MGRIIILLQPRPPTITQVIKARHLPLLLRCTVRVVLQPFYDDRANLHFLLMLPPLATTTTTNTHRSSTSPIPLAKLVYTFLATLLLLLAISCTVIVRALVVRRRRQEAIRNGTWPPSNATGIAARWGLAPPGGLNSLTDKVDLSNPPKLWEVYLNSERPHHSVEPTKGGKSISSAWRGDERTYLCWDIILPFSASLKQLDENKRFGATPSNDSSRRRRDEAITNPFSFLARFANALNPNHPHSNTGATQEGGSRSGSMIPSDPNTAPIGNRDAGTHTLQMSSLTSAVGPPSTSTPTTAGATTNATASKTPQKWRNTKPSATQKDANANSESVDEAIPVSVVVMIAMPRLPKAKQGAGMSEGESSYFNSCSFLRRSL